LAGLVQRIGEDGSPCIFMNTISTPVGKINGMSPNIHGFAQGAEGKV
jgi:hypothetical protein